MRVMGIIKPAGLVLVFLLLHSATLNAAVAIVAAYKPEIAALKHSLIEKGAVFDRQEQSKGVTYILGSFHQQDIVLFVTGMSVVNAAMSMQMAIDRYPIESILYAGIAGGVNPVWEPGDVVVAERWYYHDESAYFNPDPEHQGQYVMADYFVKEWQLHKQRHNEDPAYPMYSNFGMVFPDAVLISKQGMREPEPVHYFKADERLLKLARKAVTALPPLAVSAQRNAQLHIGGNGVTGSVFLDNRDCRNWVRRVWNAEITEITEMESAAVGQVATVNEVP